MGYYYILANMLPKKSYKKPTRAFFLSHVLFQLFYLDIFTENGGPLDTTVSNNGDVTSDASLDNQNVEHGGDNVQQSTTKQQLWSAIITFNSKSKHLLDKKGEDWPGQTKFAN